MGSMLRDIGLTHHHYRAEQHALALDAVDSFSSITSLQVMIDRLATVFCSYGIEHFIVAGLPHPSERFEKVVVLKHWSADWFDVYTKRQFVKDDPVVRMCRKTTMPFEWHEASFDRDREPRALELMNVANDFGLVRGFSVPVHSLNGYEACFSVSGSKPVFDAATKSALHLIALYAFECIRRLGLGISPRNPLTAREIEVLTWAAVGKTHADIAEILSVTERTVTAHTVNATSKLGAANKTHAVVKAMQANFIQV